MINNFCSVPSWRPNWLFTRILNLFLNLVKRKSEILCFNDVGTYLSPFYCNRIIAFVNQQPEPLSGLKLSTPNPWHASGGGGGGCVLA